MKSYEVFVVIPLKTPDFFPKRHKNFALVRQIFISFQKHRLDFLKEIYVYLKFFILLTYLQILNVFLNAFTLCDSSQYSKWFQTVYSFEKCTFWFPFPTKHFSQRQCYLLIRSRTVARPMSLTPVLLLLCTQPKPEARIVSAVWRIFYRYGCQKLCVHFMPCQAKLLRGTNWRRRRSRAATTHPGSHPYSPPVVIQILSTALDGE